MKKLILATAIISAISISCKKECNHMNRPPMPPAKTTTSSPVTNPVDTAQK